MSICLHKIHRSHRARSLVAVSDHNTGSILTSQTVRCVMAAGSPRPRQLRPSRHFVVRQAGMCCAMPRLPCPASPGPAPMHGVAPCPGTQAHVDKHPRSTTRQRQVGRISHGGHASPFFQMLMHASRIFTTGRAVAPPVPDCSNNP